MTHTTPLSFLFIVFLFLAAAAGCGCDGDGGAPISDDATAGDIAGGDAVGNDTASAGADASAGLDLSADAELPSLPLPELLAAHEAGELSGEQLREALVATSTVPATELSGQYTGVVLVAAGGGPLVAERSVTIELGGALVLAPGAELVLPAEATLTLDGALYALGSADAPVTIRGADGAPYEAVIARGRVTATETHFAWATTLLAFESEDGGPARLDDCRFDHWSDLALSIEDRDDIRVRGCQFGLETPEAEQEAEAVRGLRSGVVFEACDFGPRRGYRDVIDLEECLEPPYPVLRGCRFLGGEDDAIDLDDCSALVVGNEIRDFRPSDPDAPRGGVNGGGITGDRESRPLIVDNVVAGCYHGVGFKNGARPVLVNNTIVGCNIGVTLYQGSASQPRPHGVLLNNVLWDNRDWETGVVQDVVLNGRWWPSYNQADGDQATLVAEYNTVTASLAGDGNVVGDPALVELVPGLDSPAVDSAFPGPFDAWLDGSAFAVEVLLDELAADFIGTRRRRDDDRYPTLDRGAVERSETE